MIAKSEHRILWLPGEERMWDDDAGSRSSAGVRIDANNAHQVAAVFACLRVIAETVASLPLHVLERTPGGGKRIARELPLYRQLHSQPNGWQTSFEWREQAVFHVGLWGDAFSELKAGEIQPLHPSRMKIERIENGRLRYKYREDKGTERPINESLILQVRGPSDDGVNGMRIVEECKDAIALARACELHGARFFAAGARPGFVLSTDGQLNAEARESLRSQWDRRHGGVGNSHNTAVLTGGLKPYEIPQSSNSDAQFLELRRYQLEEIARLYRVPSWLLGVGSPGPQSEIEFVTHTILPWLRRFESAFMRDLIADDDRYLIEFDVRGLMRGDAASRSAYYRAMWDIGVLNTDDIRELENMDPVEGGDVRYRPLNMGTLGEKPTEGDVLAQQQPGSGIDGQAVEGGLAAAAGEPVVPAVPGEPVKPEAPQVADVSLNGAQITGLLAILQAVATGVLTRTGAAAAIAAAFPAMRPEQIDAILAGVPEQPAQPPQQTPPAEPAQRDCGTGAGGFKPGNKCGGGKGGSGETGGGSVGAGGDSQGGVGESYKAGGPLDSSLSQKPGSVSRESVDATALRWAGGSTHGFIDEGKTYRVFHGTDSVNVDGIKASSLKPPAGKEDSVQWYMLSTSMDVASDFSRGQDKSGSFSVVEYRIPAAELKSVLWKGQEMHGGDVQHAVRGSGLSSKYLHAVHRAGQARSARMRSLPESRALTISIDFDRTFAADPSLWGEFARQAKADGNTVVMVSRREDTPDDRQTVTDTLGDYADAFSQVLLVGGDTLKADAADAAGVNVDVWVDDSPQTITDKPAHEPKKRSRKKKGSDGGEV